MKRIIMNTAFAILFSLVSLHASAQGIIRGTITDSRNEPVVGAVVMLKGSTTTGAISDEAGKYELKIYSASKDAELVVSCLGYAEQTVKAAGRSVIDFVLEEDSQQLEETVVVGYGAIAKSDLTGSVTSVKVKDSDADRSTSIEQLMQGRAAGVQVVNNGGAPDGGVSIRIRGMSSFNSSNDPLYVVDGIIINASQGGETLISKGGDNGSSDEEINGLMGLNPRDIESIEVLKDASATAIYGALGANGVVLITTKSAKSDRLTVRFSAGMDVSNASKRMDMLTFDEYCDFLADMNALDPGTTAETLLYRIYEDPVSRTGLKVRPVDWQEECLRNAVSQRYHLALYGKPKSVTYAFAIGYNNKQGIIKGTGIEQYTMRTNIEKKTKRFEFGTRINLSYLDSKMTQSTGGGRMTPATSMIRSMVSFRPYTRNDMEEEDLTDDDEDLKASPDRWINTDHYFNGRKEIRVTPSAFAQIKISKWLTFKSVLGADYRHSAREKFKSAHINTTTTGSNGAQGTYKYFNWNWDNTFQISKRWGNHKINGTLGSSLYSNSATTHSIEGWNIAQYKAGVDAIATAPNRSIIYSESASQTLSFFARAIYNYRDRYVFTATYRLDGSSKFMGMNKWSQFPSFAAAWRVSQEPWFNAPVVSMLKLRAGWGVIGNQSVSNYQTMNTYVISRVAAHDTGNLAETSVTVTPNNFANPHLKWETSEQYNVGVDFGMWRGRVALTADAYYKTTYDLLQTKEIPGSSGFTNYYVNEGTITNRGLEFTLDAVPVKTSSLEWAITGNISFNRGRIEKISDTAARKNIWVSPEESKDVVYFEGSQIGNSAYCSQTANIFMEGYEMGLFYGYKVKGIIGVGETGTPLSDGGDPRGEGYLDYEDLNQNGYIDEGDRTVIGNPNPDFTYGFGTSLTWKDFTLDLQFNGSYGNDIFNFNSAVESATQVMTHNIRRDAYHDAWTPENTDARFPAVGKIESGDYKKFSSLYVEDGSYLRLSSVSLGYNIPVKNINWVRGITAGISVANAFIWTKYSGWDPDVNSYGSNIRKMGVDAGSYPGCRTYSIDFKFTF